MRQPVPASEVTLATPSPDAARAIDQEIFGDDARTLYAQRKIRRTPVPADAVVPIAKAMSADAVKGKMPIKIVKRHAVPIEVRNEFKHARSAVSLDFRGNTRLPRAPTGDNPTGTPVGSAANGHAHGESPSRESPREVGWVTLPPATPGPKGGLLTDLTDDIANKILLALRNSSYRGPAAQWAGIRSETLSRWISRGEKTEDEPYHTFAKLVHEAEAHAELRMLSAITGAAQDDPKNAQFVLERKHPERWSRPMQISPQQINLNFDLAEMLEKAHARALASRVIEGGGVKRVLSPLDPRRRALTEGAVDPRARNEDASESAGEAGENGE